MLSVSNFFLKEKGLDESAEKMQQTIWDYQMNGNKICKQIKTDIFNGKAVDRDNSHNNNNDEEMIVEKSVFPVRNSFCLKKKISSKGVQSVSKDSGISNYSGNSYGYGEKSDIVVSCQPIASSKTSKSRKLEEIKQRLDWPDFFTHVKTGSTGGFSDKVISCFNYNPGNGLTEVVHGFKSMIKIERKKEYLLTHEKTGHTILGEVLEKRGNLNTETDQVTHQLSIKVGIEDIMNSHEVMKDMNRNEVIKGWILTDMIQKGQEFFFFFED